MLWLAIVLVLIGAAAWTVTLLADWPLWIPIVISVVLVLGFVGFIVFRRLRAARRAAALERELLRQAAHQADQVRPDRRAEILALQQQMKAAIDSLKRSKLGAGGGRAALYSLPWYVIVGPPAAGKTTALERSGLAFAGGAKGGAKVRGTAGTRNCDWWFSRDAILLDTAGRFATEADDREEWQAFLDTVKRFRPERPVDGLVVAMSLSDLATLPDAQIEDTAKKLRERLDEVMSRLEMIVPIYILFTKADLVAGFVEFFADYGKPQRAQAWGASFALDDNRLDEPAKAFETEFDELVGVLHSRMLERLASERLPEVRSKVLQFPIEFQSLRTPLSRFVEELCRTDPYMETPILRGFYFSSGTQTGRPMERVLANMVRGFDLRLAPSTQVAVGEPQSYFVTHLFEKIIFPDRELAVHSGSRVRRRHKKQVIAAGVAALVMLFVLVPPMFSYASSRDLVEATSRDLKKAANSDAQDGAGAGVAALETLQRRVKVLEEAESKTRIPGWWGPRSAPDLLPRVRSLYVSRLRSEIQKPVQEQLSAEVRGIETLERTDAVSFWKAYDLLKLYLMLGHPKERLNVEWAAPKLAQVWGRTTRAEIDQERLTSHARYYLDRIAEDASWAWQLNASTVSRAQARLNELPLEDLTYGWLVNLAQDIPPLRAEQIFFGASAEYFKARGSAEVPGLYTALGWKKVSSALASPDVSFKVESWVLGRQTTVDDTETSPVEGVRTLYFQRYVRAWSDFLGALEVEAPSDLPSTVAELRVLSEADGPYQRLFKTLRDNVVLEEEKSLKEKGLEKAKELAAKVTDKDGSAPERQILPVERHFKPLLRFGFGDGSASHTDAPPSGLNQYLAQLTALEVALSQIADNQEEVNNEFESELRRAQSSVKRLLGGLGATTRLILEPLLMPPIRGSIEVARKQGEAAASDSWKAEVWEYWNGTLAPKFPFSPTTVDVSVAEFAEFFRPKTGILWGFFEQNLKGRLIPSGNGFKPKNAEDSFRPDFLQCLAHANEITKAVFGAGPEPTVPFTVNIHPAGANVSEISLIVDGKAVVYRNEPERWQPAQWPGKGSAAGGTLKVRGRGFTDQIPREGEFGFFRLLMEGALKPAGPQKPNVLVGSWNLSRASTITMEYKPTRGIHPFSSNFFRRMKCPPAMTAGAEAP